MSVVLKDFDFRMIENDVERIILDKGKYLFFIEFILSMVRLFGFWMVDGLWKGGMLILFLFDRKMFEKYKELCKEEFGVVGRIRMLNESIYFLEIFFNFFLVIFKNLIGNIEWKLKFGIFFSIIYLLFEEYKREFLVGYFDGDGFFEVKGGRVYFVGFLMFNKRFVEGIWDILF